MFKLKPITVFRNTPDVFFFDATIPNSNGCDVVRHGSNATSPPCSIELRCKQFYIHYEQIDYNLCVSGLRYFELLNPNWKDPYHIIKLTDAMGSLMIPTQTYHRSVSGISGSVLVNQPVRTDNFNIETEFIPVPSLLNNEIQYILDTVDPILHNCHSHETYILNIA